MKARLGTSIYHMAVLTLAIISAAAVSGCTFIGFATGIVIDNGSRHSVDLARVDSLKKGVWLEVSLDDSTEVAGPFVGTDGVYRSQYPAEYAKARKELGSTVELPALGDADSFVDTTGKVWTEDFMGFDLSREMKPLLLIKSPNEDNGREISFAVLRSMRDSAGNKIDLLAIAPLVEGFRIPSASKGIEIRDNKGLRRINASDIVSMKIDDNPKAKRLTWLAGLIGGLAVDAVCYVYIIPLIVKQQYQ